MEDMVLRMCSRVRVLVVAFAALLTLSLGMPAGQALAKQTAAKSPEVAAAQARNSGRDCYRYDYKHNHKYYYYKYCYDWKNNHNRHYYYRFDLYYWYYKGHHKEYRSCYYYHDFGYRHSESPYKRYCEHEG
jgi:hypothetical protein